MSKQKSGFTLVELLIVVGILAVLATVTVLILNPAQMISQSRDSTRMNDLQTLNKAINLSKAMGSLVDTTVEKRVYISLPDTNGVLNDNCKTSVPAEYPTLPALAAGWEYRCVALADNLRKVDGTGWLPINFSSVPSIQPPLVVLPVDPINNITNLNYYAYGYDTDQNVYAIAAKLDSDKYLSDSAANVKDGGNDNTAFETRPVAWLTGGGGGGGIGKYWVGGTGNWSDATNHWATSSGGAPGAGNMPTSTDDVFFDTLSNATAYTVTINATAYTRDFNMGNPSTGVVTLTGSSFLYTYGSLSLASGVVNNHNTQIFFNATSGTKTITTNGVNMNYINFAGSATFQLIDNLSMGNSINSGYINLSGSGVFDPNGKTVTFASAGNSSVLGPLTFYNLTKTGTGVKTDRISFSGNIIVTNLFTVNGATVTNRVLVQSSVVGTPRIITAAAISISNADFMDITGAGTGNWNLSAITGGSGDAGGNTGITFTPAATQTANGTTSFSWSNAARWTSRVPLPQDDVVVNNAFGASQTVTLDMPRAGRSINWTGATGTPAWAKTTPTTMYGSLTMISGMTNSGTALFTMGGRSSLTWTSATQAFSNILSIDMFGGTLTLQDNISTNSTIFLSAGTFNANNFNVTCGGFNGNAGLSSIARSIIMGSGTWVISGTGTIWAFGTGLVTANTSTIRINNNTATAITFAGGGQIYNNIWFSGTGTGSNTISGSNTFADFKDDGSAARSILFTAGTTQTITTFTVSGTAGNLKTINSTTTGTHALVKSGGGTISSDYLNIQHSIATPASTWYAGMNSVDNQAVATAGSGWIFTTPP